MQIIGNIILPKDSVMQTEYIEEEARTVGRIVGGVKLLGCILERRSDPYSK